MILDSNGVIEGELSNLALYWGIPSGFHGRRSKLLNGVPLRSLIGSVRPELVQ